MDCSALLTRQLAELAELISRLQHAAPDEAERLFPELSNRAVLHILSREQCLIPVWHRPHRRMPPYAVDAHQRFKQALAELLILRPTSPAFADALATFATSVEEQRWIDNDQLIPMLRRSLDIHERREVFNDIELLFETASPPLLNVERTNLPPDELIEQAEIVLSTLAQRISSTPAPVCDA